MNELIKRWVSPTPKFWKKALYLGVVLTTISAGLLVTPESYVVLPEFIKTIAGHLATAGFVLTVVAKSTVVDVSLGEGDVEK